MLKVIKELKSINMLKISKRCKVINISRQVYISGPWGPALNIFSLVRMSLQLGVNLCQTTLLL